MPVKDPFDNAISIYLSYLAPKSLAISKYTTDEAL
jgi:hypothetical protein